MGFDRRIPRGGESRVSFETLDHSGLVPAGFLPAGGGMALPVFYAGLILEELVLLAGTWLLARRLFRSPLAAFLVSVAVAGSALWADDLWLNARSIFAVPLIVCLLEEFLETGSRRRLVLAACVAAAQALGLPPGMVPVPFVAVASWFAAKTLLFGYPFGGRLKSLGWSARDLLPAAVMIVLAVSLATLRGAAPGPATAAAPADILAYAGLRHPGRYLDVLVGATPGTEITSFCGYLTIGFAVLGVTLLPRATALRLLGALLGSLLVLGLLLFALYALVPGLRPSRPLPFGGPWVRLFVAFLAGYGLDRLAARAPEARAPLVRTALGLLVAAAGLAWLSGALILQNRGPEDALLALEGASPETQSPWFSDIGLLSDALGASSLFAAFAGGTLLLATRHRTFPFACALVLFLHPLDVFAWKSRMTWLRTSAPAAAGPGPRLVPSAWLRDPSGTPSRGPLSSAASAVAALNALVVLAFTGRRALGLLGVLPDPGPRQGEAAP